MNENIVYQKGHKNSRGEDAPWLIKDHETDALIASLPTKDAAKKRLQQLAMHNESTDFLREYFGRMEEIGDAYVAPFERTLGKGDQWSYKFSINKFSEGEVNFLGKELRTIWPTKNASAEEKALIEKLKATTVKPSELNNTGIFDVEFTVDKSFDMLNHEDSKLPILIMNTVRKIVTDFIENGPEFYGLTFASELKDHGRVNLYTRFASMLSRELGWKAIEIRPFMIDMKKFLVFDPTLLES